MIGHPLAVPRQCSTCEHSIASGARLICQKAAHRSSWQPVKPFGTCREYLRAIGAEGDA